MALLNSSQQFGRKVKLTVFGNDSNGLDLSELHIKFMVKRSDSMTPNTADIRVYNLSEDTALRVKKEFTRVILQAGYESNFGVIFQGNIKQVISGRESATDTFVDIVAGDGDRAYNFAIVNATLAKGSKQRDQILTALGAMSKKGVTAGHLGDFPDNKLPRGKAMFGNARNYMRDVAASTGKVWSIQDEKVTFVGDTTYLPSTVVVLTSETGMVGTPQQTNEGVNVKCLLNPNIKPSTRVKIDERSIAKFKIDLAAINAQLAAGQPLPIRSSLSADGTYYVLVMEHEGDNRGVDFYTSMVCLNVSIAANPLNSVHG